MPDPHPLAARLWRYQAERFPLLKHGLLIAAFASSGVCVSALLAGRAAFPSAAAFAVAFAVLLGLFLLLRIADEFKDAETDARYRPERPVPRGLVSLGELGAVATATLTLQLVLTTWLAPGLVWLLALVWAYMALMTKEFFVPAWLRQRPFAYMASHMLVMPLIDLFATACDWWPAEGTPPPGLAAFLALSFCNGAIIEIGRKTWAPAMERPGVDSYSSAWGLGTALTAWLAAVAAALVLALVVATQVRFSLVAAILLGAMTAAAILAARRLLRQPSAAAARTIETLSGLWVLASYLVLGLAPMTLHVLG